MRKLVFYFLMLIPLVAGAQVAINEDGAEPNARAMLDIQGNKKGILIPRMSAADRDDISNAPTGLLVFVTDDNQFYYYDGSRWLPFGKNDGDWKVDGNDMYAVPMGNVGIGTTSPNEKFTVTGAGDINGTTNADNGGMVIEDSPAEDDGLKLYIDSDEIQATEDGDYADLRINDEGGGLRINMGKFYFDGDDDIYEGVLYGGVGDNQKTMLRYYADPGEPDGNFVILSGSGPTAVSGGGDGYRTLNNYIQSSDEMTYDSESVFILADEDDANNVAIELAVALQHDSEGLIDWDERTSAIKIFGDGMVQIMDHGLDAGPDDPDGKATLVIGDADDEHLEIDKNEIHAMNGTDAAKLMINYDGGRVQMFSGDNPGQLNLNGAGFTYALGLPNNSSDDVGKARAREWVEHSDARLKTDVTQINNALDILSRLKPRYYFQHDSQFITDQKVKEKVTGIKILDSGEYGYGFLAQELYQVVPEAVEKPADEQTDLWSVHYTELIPILTAAIQQQQKQIEALKEEIQRLRQQIRQ